MLDAPVLRHPEGDPVYLVARRSLVRQRTSGAHWPAPDVPSWELTAADGAAAEAAFTDEHRWIGARAMPDGAVERWCLCGAAVWNDIMVTTHAAAVVR